jgi:hypothetical protein
MRRTTMRALTIGVLLLALAMTAPPAPVLAGGANAAGDQFGPTVTGQPGKCVYAFDESETVDAGGDPSTGTGGVKVYYRVIGTGTGFAVSGAIRRTISPGETDLFGPNCENVGAFD